MDVAPKYKINSVYLPLLNCRARNIILVGGGGSGKSFAVAQLLHDRSFRVPKTRYVLIRKHLKHIRQSQFQELKLQISLNNTQEYFSINETEMRIRNVLTGFEFISFGLDDREKIKSIAEVAGAWIEEATELDEIDDDQIDIRIRTSNAEYLQVIRSFNPIRKNHWLKSKYFPDNLSLPLGQIVTVNNSVTVEDREICYDNVILRTNYKHNKFLDASALAILEKFKQYNPEYYKVYALAEWGDLELGLIFKRDYYQEWNIIPADARGVIYCDPNLAKKAQGDTTAIFALLFSPSEQKYYVSNACCRSFSMSSELLDTLLKFRQDDRTKLIGFDGNVNQESQWSEHVINYSKINGLPYPIIDYKRYKVDELTKNAQMLWCNGDIYFPPNFKNSKEGETILSQLYSFAGKKHSESKDDAPDALVCAIEYIYESGFAYKNNPLLNNLKLY